MAAPSASAHDVVVVGAGVIGLACAWRAAERGLSVLVAERDEPGAGASGVAAGMLAPVTEADFGEQALLALNLEGAALWPSFAAELAERASRPAGYEPSGALVVAVDRDDAEQLHRLHDFQRSLGLEAEWVGARACRRLEPRLAPGVAGAIVAPQDHQVEPRTLVRALRAACEREGATVAAGLHVSSLETESGRVAGVRCVDGRRIRARRVVVAAGCWSGQLGGVPAGAVAPVRPVKGQILRLRGSARSPLARRLVRTPRCYVVARPDGEVVVGATQEEQGFDTRVTAGGVRHLLDSASEVLPDIEELEIVEAAARLRPSTPDNGPLIGEHGPDGLVWATGHHRNGVLLAPLTAAAVAALLTGAAPSGRVSAFSPARFAALPQAAGSAA